MAALLMGAAWFIWPTPWREYRRGERILRLHRLTAKTEVLYVTDWEPYVPRP